MHLPAEDLDFIASATEGLWHELRGQSIFLTGGTGFFGSWLTESFCHVNRQLSLGARLILLTRTPTTFVQKSPHLASDPAVTLLTGDVRTFPFPSGEFPFIIHAATEARATQAANAPLEMLSTIVAGTERALQFASTQPGAKFLLASSGAVYGSQPPSLTHVPESFPGAPDPLLPASVYAEGKRLAELLCTLYQRSHRTLECKIARCWTFVGPHLPLDQHFAIGNFIRDALAGRAIEIKGDGTPRRSYLYAADLAVWLWTILFRAPAVTPINVGSDRDISILDLARTVAAVLNPHTEVRLGSVPDPGAPPSRYVPSTGRARQLLNLQQTIALEDAIRRTAAWHQR
jgi:nucleoside-diphosphate-sugar epimerase